jgi:hypothetical protein
MQKKNVSGKYSVRKKYHLLTCVFVAEHGKTCIGRVPRNIAQEKRVG